jgi:NTE family protein
VKADGVFSGGGIKGLAFAGALRAAEEAGYDEWALLAGTSAGAITAMVLAVGYDADGMQAILEETDYSRLADIGGPVGYVVNPLTRRGLTRGTALHDWLRHLLRRAPDPATTFGELDGRLQVVGVDLAHGRLVVFPDDVGLYEDDRGRAFEPDDYPIADAVRISAGFPFFFPPLELRDRVTGKPGVLVDGGVASALPVFLFDRPEPGHPTWAFRLVTGFAERPVHREIGGLDWAFEMGIAVLDTAMNAFDRRHLLDFGDRTIALPTGDVGTLDFSLDRDEREFLVRSGYEAAKAFFARRPSAENRFGVRPPLAPG